MRAKALPKWLNEVLQSPDTKNEIATQLFCFLEQPLLQSSEPSSPVATEGAGAVAIVTSEGGLKGSVDGCKAVAAFSASVESWLQCCFEVTMLTAMTTSSNAAGKSERRQAATDRQMARQMRGQTFQQLVAGFQHRQPAPAATQQRHNERAAREQQRLNLQMSTPFVAFVDRAQDDDIRLQDTATCLELRSGFAAAEEAINSMRNAHAREVEAWMNAALSIREDDSKFKNQVHEWILARMQCAQIPSGPVPEGSSELVKRVSFEVNQLRQQRAELNDSSAEGMAMNQEQQEHTAETDTVFPQLDQWQQGEGGAWAAEAAAFAVENQLRTEERAL